MDPMVFTIYRTSRQKGAVVTKSIKIQTLAWELPPN